MSKELIERLMSYIPSGDGHNSQYANDLADAVAILEAKAAPVGEREAVYGWKLVPVEPTPEMVSAAEEAHMPFGDMDIALRMAILSAPSAPAKEQGVAMPELELQAAADEAFRAWEKAGDRIPDARAYMAARDGFREGAAWLARLNATPVQQVSVPASAFASRAITHYEAALLAAFPSGSSGEVFNQWNEARRVLAAAPAAPAADAGEVESAGDAPLINPHQLTRRRCVHIAFHHASC